MTLFEFIILTTLYLFAFSYMSNRLYLYDERNSWIDVFLITLLAGTIGVIIFPMIFAEDICKKIK